MRIATAAAALVLAAAAWSSPALADGMPRQAPPGGTADYAYPAPEQLFYNWTGVYFGGNIGMMNAGDRATFRSTATESIRANASDFFAGGQAGVQFQIRDLVFGAEWFYNWAGDKATAQLASGYTVSTRLKDLMLVTGKVGYAYQNYLFYIKGGYATAGLDFQTTGTGVAAASGRGDGWVGGLGVNYAIAPRIILGAEYNYIRLNTSAVDLGGNTRGGGGIDTQSALLRLDFKFGG